MMKFLDSPIGFCAGFAEDEPLDRSSGDHVSYERSVSEEAVRVGQLEVRTVQLRFLFRCVFMLAFGGAGGALGDV
jgi:hypothetical protein